MKRKGIDMYQVGTLGEEHVLLKRLKPVLEDAVEIGFSEGDLSEGLFSERPWPPDSRIKITQVPQGEAPEDVRGAWVGIEMDAYRLPSSIGGLGITSGQPAEVDDEDRYGVRVEDALSLLAQNSPKAADWFRTNMRPTINFLSFARSEVEVNPIRK